MADPWYTLLTCNATAYARAASYHAYFVKQAVTKQNMPWAHGEDKVQDAHACDPRKQHVASIVKSHTVPMFTMPRCVLANAQVLQDKAESVSLAVLSHVHRTRTQNRC